MTEQHQRHQPNHHQRPQQAFDRHNHSSHSIDLPPELPPKASQPPSYESFLRRKSLSAAANANKGGKNRRIHFADECNKDEEGIREPRNRPGDNRSNKELLVNLPQQSKYSRQNSNGVGGDRRLGNENHSQDSSQGHQSQGHRRASPVTVMGNTYNSVMV